MCDAHTPEAAEFRKRMREVGVEKALFERFPKVAGMLNRMRTPDGGLLLGPWSCKGTTPDENPR